MALKKARATIQFRRPVLFHALSPEFFDAEVKRKVQKGKPGNDPEEWRHSHRATKEGQLFLTPSQLFSCMRTGAKYLKRGRASLMNPVSSTLQIEDDRILLDRWMPADGDPPYNDYDAPVYIDVQSVKNPNTRGSANVRYRVAANHGCTASFTMLFDDTIVSSEELHAVLIDAGNMCGLGDGRAIGYGRFDVESFEAL